jgi:hypothetical protein
MSSDPKPDAVEEVAPAEAAPAEPVGKKKGGKGKKEKPASKPKPAAKAKKEPKPKVDWPIVDEMIGFPLKLKVSESETKRTDAETSLGEKDVLLPSLQAQHLALQSDNARLEGRLIVSEIEKAEKQEAWWTLKQAK